jgi:hypothetical protein
MRCRRSTGTDAHRTLAFAEVPSVRRWASQRPVVDPLVWNLADYRLAEAVVPNNPPPGHAAVLLAGTGSVGGSVTSVLAMSPGLCPVDHEDAPGTTGSINTHRLSVRSEG